MREVKFRAWDRKYRKIIYNVQNAYDGLSCACKEEHKRACGNEAPIGSFYQILNDSRYAVMQYTGLKDKDGKEIYEGDIVSYPHYARGHKVVAVVWGEEWARWESHEGDGFVPVYGVKIIGNVYENPELLEANHE